MMLAWTGKEVVDMVEDAQILAAVGKKIDKKYRHVG